MSLMHASVVPSEHSVRDIRTFVLAGGDLPSPRGVAMQLMELAQDPDAGIAEAVRLVKSDPALTAFIIRCANAARFAGVARVFDVQRAVSRLGMNMVRVYAIALSLMNRYREGRCIGFDYDRYWARSLYAGVAMQKVSHYCDGFPGDEAFVLGLLGRIGRLAFATGAPGEYGELLRACNGTCEDLDARERAVFGFDQNELAAVLLAQWGVPTTIAEVAYWQQDPEAGGFAPDSTAYRLAGALQFCSQLAEITFSSGDVSQPLASAYLRAQILELDPVTVHRCAGQVLEEWADWSALTGTARIPARPLPEYAAA